MAIKIHWNEGSISSLSLWHPHILVLRCNNGIISYLKYFRMLATSMTVICADIFVADVSPLIYAFIRSSKLVQ